MTRGSLTVGFPDFPGFRNLVVRVIFVGEWLLVVVVVHRHSFRWNAALLLHKLIFSVKKEISFKIVTLEQFLKITKVNLHYK